MENLKAEEVKKTLQHDGIHLRWESIYNTRKNEQFYEEAFDYIIKFINPPSGSTFLDSGCGPCYHAIRLAKRGFHVCAVDFSESVLEMAKSQILSYELQDSIRLQHENILSFTFEDQTFNYILCWGVLMHIPDIEKAISELFRVLKTGGILIVSEVNMNSLQSKLLRNLKSILKYNTAKIITKPAGLEYWEQTSAGELMTRQANIQWLIKTFEINGFTIKKHLSGQFSELYNRFSSGIIRNIIHIFNHLWFKYIKIPDYSFGNIIIFQKL